MGLARVRLRVGINVRVHFSKSRGRKIVGNSRN